MGEGAQILRFPVEKGMPKDVARYKIGNLKRFRYPNIDDLDTGLIEWMERYLVGKSVMLGWSPINTGLVTTFRNGNVRHIISRVDPVDASSRPLVEVCCQGEKLFPIYNWVATNRHLSFPVSLLNMDQVNYFRVCKKCEEYLSRHGSTGHNQGRKGR